MRHVAPQMLSEVMQDGASRPDGRHFVLKAEPVQSGHFEMIADGELGRFQRENPVVMSDQNREGSLQQRGNGSGLAWENDLSRPQSLQFTQQRGVAFDFSSLETPGRQVGHGQSEAFPHRINGGEEIVALGVKYALIKMSARAED